jgi:hypothetical protein
VGGTKGVIIIFWTFYRERRVRCIRATLKRKVWIFFFVLLVSMGDAWVSIVERKKPFGVGGEGDGRRRKWRRGLEATASGIKRRKRRSGRWRGEGGGGTWQGVYGRRRERDGLSHCLNE